MTENCVYFISSFSSERFKKELINDNLFCSTKWEDDGGYFNLRLKDYELSFGFDIYEKSLVIGEILPWNRVTNDFVVQYSDELLRCLFDNLPGCLKVMFAINPHPEKNNLDGIMPLFNDLSNPFIISYCVSRI